MEKPFKIWNVDRSLRKSVVAKSLVQMIHLGKSRLEIPQTASVRVVLECDGTEVEDEEYFAFMQPNTTFQILQTKDKWQSPHSSSHSEIEGADEVDCPDGESISPRLRNSLQKMQKDIATITLLSAEDLHTIVKMPLSDLSTYLADNESFAEQIQMACRDRLDNIYEAQDTMELLRIYHAAQQNSLLVEDNSKKRKALN